MIKNDDFDFGFSVMTEDELEAVQQLASQKSAVEGDVAQLQAKIDKLYKMVIPLLNNLQKDPDKEYIYWPNRLVKIKEFKALLDKVYND